MRHIKLIQSVLMVTLIMSNIAHAEQANFCGQRSTSVIDPYNQNARTWFEITQQQPLKIQEFEQIGSTISSQQSLNEQQILAQANLTTSESLRPCFEDSQSCFQYSRAREIQALWLQCVDQQAKLASAQQQNNRLVSVNGIR